MLSTLVDFNFKCYERWCYNSSSRINHGKSLRFSIAVAKLRTTCYLWTTTRGRWHNPSSKKDENFWKKNKIPAAINLHFFPSGDRCTAPCRWFFVDFTMEICNLFDEGSYLWRFKQKNCIEYDDRPRALRAMLRRRRYRIKVKSDERISWLWKQQIKMRWKIRISSLWLGKCYISEVFLFQQSLHIQCFFLSTSSIVVGNSCLVQNDSKVSHEYHR